MPKRLHTTLDVERIYQPGRPCKLQPLELENEANAKSAKKKTAPWWVLTVVGGKADHKHPSASAVIPALGTRFFCGGNLNGGTLAEVLWCG